MHLHHENRHVDSSYPFADKLFYDVNITPGAGATVGAISRGGIQMQEVVDVSAYTSASTIQSIAVTSTLAALTPGTGLKAFFTVEGNSIRWAPLGGGSTPSATVGHLLTAGGAMEYDGPLDTFRMIAISGTTATVTVSYSSPR